MFFECSNSTRFTRHHLIGNCNLNSAFTQNGCKEFNRNPTDAKFILSLVMSEKVRSVEILGIIEFGQEMTLFRTNHDFDPDQS